MWLRVRERLFPGKPRRYWWADYQLWAELWDGVIGRDPVAAVTAVGERLDPRAAERGAAGSCADPLGPGRCPRCTKSLRHEAQFVWSVRPRSVAKVVAAVILCDECTTAVLATWRPWTPRP